MSKSHHILPQVQAIEGGKGGTVVKFFFMRFMTHKAFSGLNAGNAPQCKVILPETWLLFLVACNMSIAKSYTLLYMPVYTFSSSSSTLEKVVARNQSVGGC